DVHALLVQLARDRLHTRAAHAHAGADGIDAAIIAFHGNFCAHARITGSAENLDQALAHFRDFKAEQLNDQRRIGTAHDQLRTAVILTHLLEITQNAIARAHRLAWNGCLARNQRLGIAAQLDENVAAIDTLDHAAHQLADAIGVLLGHLLTLSLAYLLEDYLLGGLRGDAPESN